MWRLLFTILFGAILLLATALALQDRGGPPLTLASLTSRWQCGAAPDIDVSVDVRSPWGQRLNPSGTIPACGFRAVYFNRTSPRAAVFEEAVDSIAIRYAWDNFHGIDSRNFGAYWVGRIHFDAATTKQFSVSQGWAKSRILIDGKVVFDKTNTSGSFIHEFTPGDHLIEVEYSNNWHTVKYKVTIEDEITLLTEDQVAAYFRDHEAGAANLYFVGLYESAAKDAIVDVALPRTGKPVVLWLSSYEAIDWRISSSDTIDAVVISSYSPGSRASGAAAARVLHQRGWSGVTAIATRCNCDSGHFLCEDGTNLADVEDRLAKVTKLALSGYAAQYSAATVSVIAANAKGQETWSISSAGETLKNSRGVQFTSGILRGS